MRGPRCSAGLELVVKRVLAVVVIVAASGSFDCVAHVKRELLRSG